MKKIAIIHRCGWIHKRGWSWLGYDLFYKPNILERLLGWEPEWASPYDYRMAGCPYVRRFLKENPDFIYFSSGDTGHIKEVLKELGLKNEKDVDGLVRMLVEKGYKVKMAGGE